MAEEVEIAAHERVDDLQRNGYRIIQDPGKFCFGMDAVLLAGFAVMKPGETALDLGCGNGIIPLLMKGRYRGKHYTGLEIQTEMARMASRSVRLNHLENDIDIIEGDLRRAGELFPASSFDIITSNPPYMNDAHGLQNPELPKAIARHEILCTLEDVTGAAARLLRPGGRFCMVHRPRRLIEILSTLQRYQLEPKRIRFVHPFADHEANMVLIEAVRGGRPLVRVEAPLIVFREPGIYTDEIREKYGY